MKALALLLLLFPALAGAQSTWSFAVSGDSRNCGDLVMPAIAQQAHAAHAQFYWHLGDFRKESAVDEDLQDAYLRKHGMPIGEEDYLATAWQDFIAQQIAPFERFGIPVYLSTGNHEFIHKTRPEFDATFAKWLTGRDILKSPQHRETSYYHWHHGNVDFITLDNGTPEQFDAAQMDFLKAVLQADERDARIRTVVVGMHKALPDSVGCDHSMNEQSQRAADPMLQTNSGHAAYLELLDFRDRTHKNVYLLSSHSHFYMSDIFGDLAPPMRLPGWIVGTAGASRYPLPANDALAGEASEWTYGFLLGSVYPDGSITFRFHQVTPDDYSSADRARIHRTYSPQLQNSCWYGNKDDHARPAQVCSWTGPIRAPRQ